MPNLFDVFGGIGNALGGLFGGGNKQPQYGAGKYGPPTQQQSQGNGGFMNSIFKNPGAGMAGLGVMGLGQLLNKPQKAPDFMQNPAMQQMSQWSTQANHPLDPNVQQSIQHSLDIQNEQQLRNLRDVYKNLRPGTDYTTDSAYQRDAANLNRQISMNNADAMANAQLASNQQQLGNLSNLGNLQVGQQMYQSALDAQKRQQQNEMFGNIGSMLLQSGIGMPDFMKLFKIG